jgi:hypothetical protein
MTYEYDVACHTYFTLYLYYNYYYFTEQVWYILEDYLTV